jgi:hypothetical protein
MAIGTATVVTCDTCEDVMVFREGTSITAAGTLALNVGWVVREVDAFCPPCWDAR